MKGTEKQIKWATEIKENVIKTFEAFIVECKEKCPTEEIKAANIAAAQERIAALSVDSVYSGDIIHLFKDIRFTGDLQDDLGDVLAVYRVAFPYTDGQKRILIK